MNTGILGLDTEVLNKYDSRKLLSRLVFIDAV